MKKNFRVGQSNEIIHLGRTYDLHNLYSFGGLSIDGERNVRLTFLPDPQFGKGEPPVEIHFEGVDYLEISKGFGTATLDGLDEMGYIGRDWIDDSSLHTEEQAGPSDDLYFRLFGGYIRIHATYAQFLANS
jgi:hypothetical protein